MVNGVRTNKKYYLCIVKEATLTSSKTEVLVVTTWQIKAKDGIMPCAIRGHIIGHE